MQYVCFLLQCDCNYKLSASKMSVNQGKKEGGTEVQTAPDVQSQLCTQSQCSCDSWYWVKQTHLDFIICSLGTQPGFKRDVDCQVFSIILSFTPCQVTVLSIPAIVKTCVAVRSEEFLSRRNEKSCQCCLKPWSETACKKVNRRTLTQVGRRRRTAFLDKGTNFYSVSVATLPSRRLVFVGVCDVVYQPEWPNINKLKGHTFPPIMAETTRLQQ